MNCSDDKRKGRFTNLDANKLRGGYYTSPNVAEWLSHWAIRSSSDHVLEPSCGNGAFVEAAAQRLMALGAIPKDINRNLVGVEIISSEAKKTSTALQSTIGSKGRNSIVADDFFSWWQSHKKMKFDAVIGNPPFIRYQSFPEPHRSIAMELMGDLGLSPNRLTNVWVPFVAIAAESLNINGRLALVLPAELLQVTYASQLRSYLTDRFSRIDIVTCNELFFENAQQEVVLLLAQGALERASEKNICKVALTETPHLSSLLQKSADKIIDRSRPKIVRHESEKWLKFFLTQKEITFMRRLRESSQITSLATHASIDVGVVTGKNEFFVLNNSQVLERKLSKYTTSLISRSIQLRGAQVDERDYKELSINGDRVYLLDISNQNGSRLSSSLLDYIRDGESKEVHKGYKCSIRKPWYNVPSVWSPDGFMFRQIHDFPRVVYNQIGATSTDTIHRMKCISDTKMVISNMYTHLTAASAEIEGRSYGGGVLELEPTEAERLLIPSKLGKALSVAEIDRLIRDGRIEEVLEENDNRILIGEIGLSKKECDLLKQIWVKMRNRRMSRKGRKKRSVCLRTQP